MRAEERLIKFVEAERGRIGTDTGNILGIFVTQLTTLIQYLEVTRDEYAAAAEAFLDNVERQKVLREHLGGGPRPVAAEEFELMAEGAQATLVLHLRIETFYLFAKILLDKLARLLPHYFGSARGVKLSGHSSLVGGALPRFASALGLAPVPASLTALIDDLGRRVSDYRDRSITHAYSPRTFRGTTFELVGRDAAILTGTLYPRSESETSTTSETPRTLLPAIEGYVLELVDYLEGNRHKAKAAG